MKRVTLNSIVVILALFLSACGGRDFTKQPEVKAEIAARQGEGWDFVEMVGEAHGKPDPNGRSIRRSDDAGSLTVYAMNTGVDGHGSEQKRWERTFRQDGFEFMEVKIMTSPADGYSLVFRRMRSAENTTLEKDTPSRTSRSNQRRVTLEVESGLPSLPWMAYKLGDSATFL
jgi:hypothetical protein